MNRYYGLAARLRQRFGERVQKIPLDAGFSCPNRDGTLSVSGCVFCNPEGSGSGMYAEGRSLSEQWDIWKAKLSKRYKARLFLAYLQSYSNTYGPLPKIQSVLEEIAPLPGLAGLCLGTRPDCIDPEKIAAIKDTGLSEIWLDLGLQSSNDQTLQRINRGHDSASFARALELAYSNGIQVCAHLIAGLPGEDEDDFLESVNFINSLPVSGVKFHNLFVCEHTALEKLYLSGDYSPWSLEKYTEALGHALAVLRQDIVVHRLSADPAPGELVAPQWAGEKGQARKFMAEYLEKKKIWQGCDRKDSSGEPPEWFGPDSLPPGLSPIDLKEIFHDGKTKCGCR